MIRTLVVETETFLALAICNRLSSSSNPPEVLLVVVHVTGNESLAR